MKRPYILVIIGVVLILAAIALNYSLTKDVDDANDTGQPTVSEGDTSTNGDVASTGAETETNKPGDTSGADDAPKVENPSFDVVRVSPDGSSVIAGRAEPNSKVTVKEGKDVLGEAQADDRGEWVLLPEKPLAPGDRELSVESKDAKGNVKGGDENVVVLIPEKPAKDTKAPIVKEDNGKAETGDQSGQNPIIAMKVPSDGKGPAKILQGPGAKVEQDGKADAKKAPQLSVGVVDYNDKGQVSMSGKADPDSNVRVYLDNRFVGNAQSNKTGDWGLTLGDDINPGQYKLRADEVDKSGKVTARLELPFERADVKKLLQPGQRYIVQPGNSLWRIARRAYGEGIKYWVIYNQNEDQIKDPDLIYPGQIFALPQKGKGDPSPSK